MSGVSLPSSARVPVFGDCTATIINELKENSKLVAGTEEKKPLLNGLATQFRVTRVTTTKLQSFAGIVEKLDASNERGVPLAGLAAESQPVHETPTPSESTSHIIDSPEAEHRQRSSLFERLLAVVNRGSVAVMALFSSLKGSTTQSIRCVAGYFSNALSPNKAASAEALMFKESLTVSAEGVIKHVNNIISEIETKFGNEGRGLSASDVNDFIREGRGSDANIRMVITGLSNFIKSKLDEKLNGLMTTDKVFVDNFKARHNDLLTTFSVEAEKLLDGPLFEKNKTAASEKITLRCCGTRGEAGFQAKIEEAKKEGFLVSDEQIGIALHGKLKKVAEAFAGLPAIEWPLES